MSLKKILIVIAILLIIAAGAAAAYFFFFKEATPTTKTIISKEEEVIVIGSDEESLPALIQPLSPEPALSPTIDGDFVKYYSAANGNVFQSSLNGGNATRLSADVLDGLWLALWSPIDKTKAINFFDQNGQEWKYLYDFSAKKSSLLDAKIGSVAWSPAENKIVYQYYDSQSGLNNISIANPDGSEWKNIFQTRIKDLIVEWPATGWISLRSKPSGLAQSVVYALDAAGQNFQKLISETYGLTLNWSPIGNKALYSETDSQGKNLKLKLLDAISRTARELSFATLPEKCAWASDDQTIYCAVPTLIPSDAVIPDDYYKGLTEFSDAFYRIDLTTGQVSLLAKASQIDAEQLSVSGSKDYLIFVNRKDGLLYSLTL